MQELNLWRRQDTQEIAGYLGVALHWYIDGQFFAESLRP